MVLKGTPAVIHVYGEMSRDGIPFFGGNRDGIFHRIDHPDLGNGDHQTEPNWATVFGGIMAVIVNEVRNRETEGAEVDDFFRSEFGASGKVLVIFE